MPGPRATFDEFVVTRASALLRFAYLLTSDRELARDLVQEALAKASRRWSFVSKADRPEAYVRRIVVNEFLSWRRRKSSGEIPGPVPETIADDDIDALAERDLIWRILAGLPRRQRAVLVLRYYEALPDSEIGALLDCAEGTVRSLASRAFETLRRHPELTTTEI